MGRGMGGGLRHAGPQRAGGERKTGELPPDVRERIAAANELRKADKHAEAVAIYADLADKLSRRQHHRIAVHLAIQAAESLAAAGSEAAAEAVQLAVGYAAPLQNAPAVARRFGRVAARLRAHGDEAAATLIETEAMARLGVHRLPGPTEGTVNVNRAMRRRLPNRCISCGARVDAERVEFTDEGTADCANCGDVLLG